MELLHFFFLQIAEVEATFVIKSNKMDSTEVDFQDGNIEIMEVDAEFSISRPPDDNSNVAILPSRVADVDQVAVSNNILSSYFVSQKTCVPV